MMNGIVQDEPAVRQLIFLRHGKAVPGFRDDHGRKLTPEGEHLLRENLKSLRERNFIPGKILSSSAERTKRTARIFCEVLDLNPAQISIIPELYNAPHGKILEEIWQLPEEIKSAVIIGHNPGISDVINHLSRVPGRYMLPGEFRLLSGKVSSWVSASQTKWEFQ